MREREGKGDFWFAKKQLNEPKNQIAIAVTAVTVLLSQKQISFYQSVTFRHVERIFQAPGEMISSTASSKR